MKRTFCTTTAIICAAVAMTALLLGTAATSQAATITTVASGNWNDRAVWGGGNIPGRNDSVIISSGFTVTGAPNVTCAALEVQSGGTMNVADRNFRVLGTTLVGGTLTHTSTGGNAIFDGTVTISSGGIWLNPQNEGVTYNGSLINNGRFDTGAGAQLFKGVNAVITHNGTAFNSAGGSIAMSGTGQQIVCDASHGFTIPSLTSTAVTNNCSGGLTVSTSLAGTAFTQGTGALLTIVGTSPVTTLVATAAGNTVDYSGAAQTVRPAVYNNLTLSGSGVKTMTGVGSITGNLILSGTVTASTASNLAIGGNLVIGDGTVLTVGAFSLNVAGITTIGIGTSGSLSIASATGTKTFSGTVTINNGGSLTESAPAQLAFGSDVIINSGGTLTENGTALVGIAGSLLNNGAYSTSAGVHTFSGAGRTIGGLNPVTIPSLAVSGTVTNKGTLTVSTSLAGTGALTNGANATLNIGAPLVAPTLLANSAGNTVNFNGNVPQTIPSSNYYNLTSSGSGTRAVVSGGTIGIAGVFTPGSNAYTTTGSTVNYNGGTQAVAVIPYNNLTLSGSGAKSLQPGTSVIGGSLTLNGAVTASTVAALAINGNLTVGDGSDFSAAGHALTVSGTTTVGGVASGSLSITSAAGTKTFSGPVIINYGASLIETAPAQISFGSDVTINSGGTLTENGAAPLGMAGSLTNNGAYSAGIGQHTFSGSGKTIGGLNPVVIPNLVINAAATNIGTLTVPTSLAGAGTLTNGANAVLNIGAASVSPTLVASASGNRVNYTGSAQAVKATTYTNLVLSGSGDKAIALGTSVSGGLSIAPSGSVRASIGDGLAINAGGLTMGGLGRANGSWGSSSSPATNRDDVYFAATSGYLAVNASAPFITSSATAAFIFDAANTFTVTTSGTGPVLLDYQGGLPTGVTFIDNGNGTATISGNPNVAGTFRLTIAAANSVGSVTQNFTLTVALPGGVSSADTEISVTPNRHLFGVVTIGSCGAPFTFTVRNSGTTPRVLGTLAIGGNDADQYSIGAVNSCSASTLAPGTSCTVEVMFCPTSTGSRSATLLIPSNDPESPLLAAALYNYESLEEEAARRMPPVLESLYIPAVMNAGQQYTITWSQLGYDEDYLSRILLFNCTGTPVGACGSGATGSFADSGNLLADSSTTGTWSYTNGTSTVYSKRFDYSYTFTAPAAGDIVIRFYHKSMSDNAAGLATLSLLIPGKLNPSGTSYYDNQGRRLMFTITP